MPTRTPVLFRRGGRLRTRYVSLSVAIGVIFGAVAVGLPGTAAVAAPQADLASATAQATRLEQQITANSHRADVLDEQYLQAQAAAVTANAKIAETQRQIAATTARSEQLHRELGSRAATLYMGAGSSDPVGINVTSVQELGSRAKYSAAAASKDQRILDDLRVADEQLNIQHNDLEHQLSAAQDQQRAVQTAQHEVAQINTSMQNLLNSTKANIRTLAAKIEQQQRAAAAIVEQARIQRLAVPQAAAQPTSNGGGNGSVGSIPTDNGNALATLPAPSQGAAAAVAYARAQLGKPYVYAGVGPDSYDCSGLTMMAWRQAGVSMDHGSRSQYNSFPHVPLSQLQPGDLVFFGPSGPMNGHVGMVVGPGMMIDAPHTGAFVELVSYYWPDLVPMGARP